MRYRLRTLLIALAVLPPVLAGVWWAMEMPPIPVILIVWIAADLFIAWRQLKGDWPPSPGP
jgi:hypothetical protein